MQAKNTGWLIRVAVWQLLCTLSLSTLAHAGATFSPTSGLLHIPAVVVWGLGTFEVNLTLADSGTLEFALASAARTVESHESPATFRFDTMTIHVPVVTVLVDGGSQNFTADFQVIAGTDPLRFRVSSGQALPAATFAELTPAVFSNLPPNLTAPMINDPTRTFYLPYQQPRTWGYGNVFGNGRNDLVVAPTFFSTGPELPIELWRNNGDGTFDNRTADLLSDVVTTRVANNVFVADLNGDGIADIFIVDQGFEPPGAALAGARNKLLLSGPDGRLHDRSSTLPVNYDAFNHVSAMIDFNGDGCPDFLITEVDVSPIAPYEGVYLLLNDCTGGFTKVTDIFPVEIAERNDRTFPFNPSIDYQKINHANAADLDGDGHLDVITGSVRQGDIHGFRQKTIRIYDGRSSLREVARLPLPSALADMAVNISGFAFGDLDGDGRVDVIAYLEMVGYAAVVIYKNLGHFSFIDATTQFLPGYETTFINSLGRVESLGFTRTIEVSPGARPGMSLGCFQQPVETLFSGRCLSLNPDGSRLIPWGFTKGGNPATVQDMHNAVPDAPFACPFHSGMPMFFDVNGDGVKDVVLLNGGCVTSSAPRQTNKLQTIVIRSGRP